jgi:hypothetical protein
MKKTLYIVFDRKTKTAIDFFVTADEAKNFILIKRQKIATLLGVSLETAKNYTDLLVITKKVIDIT